MAEWEDGRQGGAPQIDGIVTSCRDCIFAQYDGDEQAGCDFDRLDKFEVNGAEIVGQDDGHRRYCLVVGRFCNACRHYEWGNRHPAKDWHAIVEEEFRVRCCFLIYADSRASREDVGASLDSVLDQGPVRPHRVAILLNGHPEPVTTYLRMIRERGVDVPWEVRDVVVDHPGESIDYGRAIDIGVQAIEGATYYCVSRAGYRWPPDYLSVINHAINHKLDRVVALLPDDDGNGLMMGVVLHNKLLHGNQGWPALDKLLQVARLEETGHMIKTWDDLRASCV